MSASRKKQLVTCSSGDPLEIKVRTKTTAKLDGKGVVKETKYFFDFGDGLTASAVQEKRYNLAEDTRALIVEADLVASAESPTETFVKGSSPTGNELDVVDAENDGNSALPHPTWRKTESKTVIVEDRVESSDSSPTSSLNARLEALRRKRQKRATSFQSTHTAKFSASDDDEDDEKALDGRSCSPDDSSEPVHGPGYLKTSARKRVEQLTTQVHDKTHEWRLSSDEEEDEEDETSTSEEEGELTAKKSVLGRCRGRVSMGSVQKEYQGSKLGSERTSNIGIDELLEFDKSKHSRLKSPGCSSPIHLGHGLISLFCQSSSTNGSFDGHDRETGATSFDGGHHPSTQSFSTRISTNSLLGLDDDTTVAESFSKLLNEKSSLRKIALSSRAESTPSLKSPAIPLGLPGMERNAQSSSSLLAGDKKNTSSKHTEDRARREESFLARSEQQEDSSESDGDDKDDGFLHMSAGFMNLSTNTHLDEEEDVGDVEEDYDEDESRLHSISSDADASREDYVSHNGEEEEEEDEEDDDDVDDREGVSAEEQDGSDATGEENLEICTNDEVRQQEDDDGVDDETA